MRAQALQRVHVQPALSLSPSSAVIHFTLFQPSYFLVHVPFIPLPSSSPSHLLGAPYSILGIIPSFASSSRLDADTPSPVPAPIPTPPVRECANVPHSHLARALNLLTAPVSTEYYSRHLSPLAQTLACEAMPVWVLLKVQPGNLETSCGCDYCRGFAHCFYCC